MPRYLLLSAALLVWASTAVAQEVPVETVPADSATMSGPIPMATDELIGLTPVELRQLLGEPTLMRQDPPAQIWQYAADICVMHVFLYLPDDGGQRRGTYVSTRMRDGSDDNPGQCMASVTGIGQPILPVE
ncbi:MAG: hypothetical protein O2910_08935 [Proteobacteria bacterium]|nr:hypothetical protein [Pseudomonadota bacterium]